MVLLLLIYRIKELLWHTLLRHLHYLKVHRDIICTETRKKRAYFVSIGIFVMFGDKNFYTWIR